MKALLLSAAAFVLVLFTSIAASPPVVSVTFTWVDTNAPGQVDAYYIYTTYNPGVPKSNWTMFAAIPAGTNQFQTNVTAGSAFYAMTCSNFWGETGFSMVVGTPALLSSTATVGIRRP